MPVIHKVVAVPSNRLSLFFDNSFLGFAFLVLVSQPALVAGQGADVLENDSSFSNWGLGVKTVLGLGVLMAVVLGMKGYGVRGQREIESELSFEEKMRKKYESPSDRPPSIDDLLMWREFERADKAERERLEEFLRSREAERES